MKDKGLREILINLYNAETGTELNEAQAVEETLRCIADWLESRKKKILAYTPNDPDRIWNACIDELKKEVCHL
jgi:hypothetical protein